MIDLDTFGAAIGNADDDAAERARQRLTQAGVTARSGRLADLAVWWAAVRGDDEAPAPTRIVHLGGDDGGPTLPTGTVEEALDWGVATADELVDSGTDLLLVSVDDVIAARLVAAELMGLDAVEANGWPQDRGIDDDVWMDEAVVLRDGLRRTAGLRGTLGALLAAVDSPQLAGAAALLVQATARRTPALLDGAGAAAAALVARRTAWSANQWWQAAQLSTDPLHERTLSSLALEPLLSLGLSAETGVGARLGLAVVREACALL